MDGYEPHGIIYSAVMTVRQCHQPCTTRRCTGEVYPGYGIRVGTGEGYTGYYPDLIPGPIIEHILALRPYPRPYEGNLRLNNEVSQIWLRIDLRIDPELTRIRPSRPPTRTGPQMALRCPYPGPQNTYAQNKGLFDVLLTIAEVKHLPSRDWIRPPSCCQE